MKKKLNISVVCATHEGKKKIKNLIISIYNNYIWPREIVVCGTSQLDLINVPSKIRNTLNIKFIFSKKKGQVHQRQKAIEKSTSDYILQIDDDVTVAPNFFSKLEKYVKNKKILTKFVISALIIQNNKSLQAGTWNIIYRKYFLFRLIIYFLNGGKKIKEYSILKSGRCIPYIRNFHKKKISSIKKLEWLCSTIMYHKNCRKVVKDYIQKSEKAFYEDVFFSHQLYLNGYVLLIDTNVIGIHDNQPYTSIKTYFKTLKTQYFIVRFFKKSLFFFYIDVAIFTFIHSLRDIFKNLFLMKQNKL